MKNSLILNRSKFPIFRAWGRLFFLCFFFIMVATCTKREEVIIPPIDGTHTLNTSGILLDAWTKSPLGGEKIFVYSTYWEGGWDGTYKAKIEKTFTTQSDGTFNISITGDNDRYYLGHGSPSNDWTYADLNGKVVAMFLYPDLYRYSGDVELKTGQFYKLELFSIAFYNYQLSPLALTPDLKKDTLIVREYLARSGKYELVDEVYLGNLLELYNFRSRINALVDATHVKGTYELRRNGLIKSGSFDVPCPPGDTTKIILELQ